MTHLSSPSVDAPERPEMLSTPGQQQAATTPRHLDRARLQAGIASRKRRLADLEAAMVAACERAAIRRASPHVRRDDRETCDHAMWRRYLDAATRLEPEFGPPMRRLHQEIEQLVRLTDLPIAA